MIFPTKFWDGPIIPPKKQQAFNGCKKQSTNDHQLFEDEIIFFKLSETILI